MREDNILPYGFKFSAFLYSPNSGISHGESLKKPLLLGEVAAEPSERAFTCRRHISLAAGEYHTRSVYHMRSIYHREAKPS